MKSFIIILITTIITVVNCYDYNVFVKLGHQEFEEVDGSVKFKIYGQHSNDTFRLIQTALKPGGEHLSTVEINYRPDQIQKVTAYYTLTEPYRYPFRKPIIYLHEITLGTNEKFNVSSKSFRPINPNRKFHHKEEIPLILYKEA